MSLRGARVQRIDAPLPSLFALTLHGEGRRRVLLIGLDPTARGAGLVDERPRGLPASSFVQLLRRELEGGRLEAIESSERWLRVSVRRDEGIVRLGVRRAPKRDLLVLADPSGRVRGASQPHRLSELGLSSGAPIDWQEQARAYEPVEEARLEEEGAGLRERAMGASLSARQKALLRRLRKARARAERKVRAIEADAGRVAEVPELRREAGLILSNLHSLGKRDARLRCTDWELDPPAEVEIPIDLSLGAKEQAERLYHRAKRLERGASIAARRAELARREAEALAGAEGLVRAAESEAELDEAAMASESLGISVQPRAGGARRKQAPRLPYRRFVASGGHVLLVGRGAADNDALTLRHSKPSDHWLHARGRTGAHVVIPLDRGQQLPSELLVDAATLAAHFSDARGEPVVEVQHTPRRHVHKRRGAAIGAVTVEREKVMAIRVEAARLERLLGGEQRDRGV